MNRLALVLDPVLDVEEEVEKREPRDTRCS